MSEIGAVVREVEYCKCHGFVCAMQTGVSPFMILEGCGRMINQTNAVMNHEKRIVMRQIMMWFRTDLLNIGGVRMRTIRDDESNWPSNGQLRMHGWILIGYDNHIHRNGCVCTCLQINFWSNGMNQFVISRLLISSLMTCSDRFSRLFFILKTRANHRCSPLSLSRLHVDFFFDTFFSPQLMWPWKCMVQIIIFCILFLSYWGWHLRRVTDLFSQDDITL